MLKKSILSLNYVARSARHTCTALAVLLFSPAIVLAHPYHEAHGNHFEFSLSHEFFHLFDVLRHSAWLTPEIARGLDLALLSLGLFLVFARSRQYAVLDFRRVVGMAAVLLAISRGVLLG